MYFYLDIKQASFNFEDCSFYVPYKEWKSFFDVFMKGLEKDNGEKVSNKNLNEYDITTEAWREYDFSGRVYRIEKPVKLFIRPGGSTHRVLDSENVVHCVPAPGNCGCVLRWQNKDKSIPVNF